MSTRVVRPEDCARRAPGIESHGQRGAWVTHSDSSGGGCGRGGRSETGEVLKSFNHTLHRKKKVDFIEQFNEKLLVKQGGFSSNRPCPCAAPADGAGDVQYLLRRLPPRLDLHLL